MPVNEPKQKLIDQQLLMQLDSLRKSGALNLGEANWYNARRPGIGGLETAGTRSHENAADVAEAVDTAVAVVEAPRALSRLERKTIEKILLSHGVASPSA
jgi:hypothetical protein